MLVVFIPIYIVITLAVGFYAFRRIKTSSDFTLAGKSLSTLLVGVTIFATWFSSMNVTASPGLFAEESFVVLIPYIVAGPLCLLFIGHFFAKKLYEMDLVTISDFFSIRYNKQVVSLPYLPITRRAFQPIPQRWSSGMVGVYSRHTGVCYRGHPGTGNISTCVFCAHESVGPTWSLPQCDFVISHECHSFAGWPRRRLSASGASRI